MKMTEKIAFLEERHLGEWMKTRQEVFEELSDKQSVFCLCGRLATGLHESHCQRFINKVRSETVKRLAHLLTA